MRILLGADFHLGARFSRLGEAAGARREDLMGAFQAFVHHAADRQHQVDLVLIAGDLFDHHLPAPRLLDTVHQGLERVVAAGRGVVLIPGLHDGAGYPDSIYRSERWPTGITILKSPGVTRTELPLNDRVVHLYGMAWDPGRTPPDALLALRREPGVAEGVHVGLLHGSLPIGSEWGKGRCDFPIPLDALSRSELDLVVVGHDHEFAEQRFGRTLVVVPGSLERLSSAGSAERHLARVASTPGGLRLERIPYAARPVHAESIDVTGSIEDMEALEEHLRALGGTERIVEVRLRGRLAFIYRRDDLLAALRPHFFHLEIEDSELMLDERWTQRLAGERTVRGLFVRRMRERLAAAPAAKRRALELALRHGLAEFDAEGVSDAA